MTPLLDLKYARRLGLTPTSNPSAMDTLFFEGPPSIAYDQALATATGGALVLSVLGVHTQDFTSGDFSLSAPQTLAIGAGGVAGRLRATISGNVFELLRSAKLSLVRFPGEHTPGLLVHCRLDPA
jgi:PmbA protein